MAKVVYAPLVTAIKGSIGGVTFQANSSGQICRTRSRPKRTRTNQQQLSQPKLLVWLPAWRELTLPQQQDWNTLAAAHTITDMWGRIRQLTGFNLFARCNAQAAIFAEGPYQDAPLWEPPDPLNSVTLTLSQDHLQIASDPDPLPANVGAPMYLTPPIWRSESPFRQHMRLIFIFPPGNSGPWNIEQAWCAKFGLTWPPPNTDGMTIQAVIYPVDETNGLTAAPVYTNAKLPPP